jgi:hypothetical protein
MPQLHLSDAPTTLTLSGHKHIQSKSNISGNMEITQRIVNAITSYFFPPVYDLVTWNKEGQVKG